MNYTVYMHISPSNKKYVGITSQEPKKRWLSGHGYSNNQYFSRAIEKYGWDNFQHIVIARGLTKDEAEWLEVELIRVNDSANHSKGYNIDLGGNSIGKISEETKRKLSMKKIGTNNPMYGKTGVNCPFYGKHHSEEHKAKLSEERKGSKNPRAKSVICITTKRIFLTAKEGAEYYNLQSQNIGQCCKGKIKSAGKHNNQKLVWRYLNHKHNKTYRVKKEA